MTSNFCAQCGSPVPGVFCTNCGASTASSDTRARPGSSGRALRLESDEDPEESRPPAFPDQAPSTSRAPLGHLDAGAPLTAVGPERRLLHWETPAVMLAFLLPGIATAVILFAQHLARVGEVTTFPDIVSNQPVTNMVLGILDYTTVLSVVPLALLLLARTGQTPSVLGLGVPRLLGDGLPGLGLAVAAFLGEFVVLIPLEPLVKNHPSLISKLTIGHVPSYYVVWGLAISAITAVTEEVMMSGYLLTRLEQLGWSPARSLTVSLALRTSYHVYYGLGFLLTIPFGYLVTRSFQKHGRLMRPIVAHFLFDGVLLTIAVLR